MQEFRNVPCSRQVSTNLGRPVAFQRFKNKFAEGYGRTLSYDFLRKTYHRRSAISSSRSDHLVTYSHAEEKCLTIKSREGASTDLSVIWSRLVKVRPEELHQSIVRPFVILYLLSSDKFLGPLQLGTPYWSDPEEGGKARWHLAGVVALTLGTTGVR